MVDLKHILRQHYHTIAGFTEDVLMIVWVYALIIIFLGMAGLGIGGIYWMWYQAWMWVLP